MKGSDLVPLLDHPLFPSPDHPLFPLSPTDSIHTSTCDVSVVWLTISGRVVIMSSCDSKSCYKLVFISHTVKQIKKKLQGTSAKCGHCRKDDTSTICAHLSQEVV